MSEKHPYPLPVRVAVAETIAKQVLVMREWSDLTQQTRYAFLRDADEVLTTLWEASRITTVSEAEQLADDVRVITPRGAYMAPWSLDPEDLPAHVIDWGGSDA